MILTKGKPLLLSLPHQNSSLSATLLAWFASIKLRHRLRNPTESSILSSLTFIV